MKGSEQEAKISRLILDWKLDEATGLLKDSTTLSGESRVTLYSMLNQYAIWKNSIEQAKNNIQSNPESVRLALKSIPDKVLLTYPDSRTILEELRMAEDDISISQAMEKCESAEKALINEFSDSKASAFIEEAKKIYPDWENSSKLREKIEDVSSLRQKVIRGLEIQREISALREKGGKSAYQQALELLTEYTSLQLENYDLTLFDVKSEQEKLVKMMARADGESWTYRLSPSSSGEILRLEQSIHSLEDAENKNLRVLFNNNSRLMVLLSKEQEKNEEGSEQRLRIDSRVNELRAKNTQIGIDIQKEVEKRSGEYCDLAEKAIEVGELQTAEFNLRLAKETGKPANELADDEFLGEVSLPVSVLDRINEIEEKYKIALEKRSKTENILESIRTRFHSAENCSLKQLIEWINALDKEAGLDENTPGLRQIRDELGKRLDSVKAYEVQRSESEIERDLKNTQPDQARKVLDQISLYLTTPEEKDFYTEQNKKIVESEKLIAEKENLEQKISSIYSQAINTLVCRETDIRTIKALGREMDQFYQDHGLQAGSDSEHEKKRKLEILQSIRDNKNLLAEIQGAVSSGSSSEKAMQAADDVGETVLIQVREIQILLAQFWYMNAKQQSDFELGEKDLDKAENFASNAEDPELSKEISAYKKEFFIRNENGRRLNTMIEMLNSFLDQKNYAAGLDYISKNVSAADRKDFQINNLAEKIGQGYRISQSEDCLNKAKEAFENENFAAAEELVGKSLDLFYTIEGAQLQKEIEASQQVYKQIEDELDQFLDFDITGQYTIDERKVHEIRDVMEKIQQLNLKEQSSPELRIKVGAAQSKVDRLVNQELEVFNSYQRQIENCLLKGEGSFAEAHSIIQRAESTAWISGYNSQILQLKQKLNLTENACSSLKILINQSNYFLRQGDFRSAKKILESFSSKTFSACPEWIFIMKENAEIHIDQMAAKYQEIQNNFLSSGNSPSILLEKMKKILDSMNPDEKSVSELSSQLERSRIILEKEIGVNPENNVFLNNVNYLNNILLWVNHISSLSFDGELPLKKDLSAEIAQVRQEGRTLYDNLPPTLVDVQPDIAEKNRWLEKRARNQRALASISENLNNSKSIKHGKGNEVKTAAAELKKVDLLPEEKKGVDQIQKILNEEKKRRLVRISILTGMLLLMSAVYIFLPQLLPMIFPEKNTMISPSMTETQFVPQNVTPVSTEVQTTSVPENSDFATTESKIFSTETKVVLTPIVTFTPELETLTGIVNSSILGVYALPSGLSRRLSNENLEKGTKVEIIRYCEYSGKQKGEYWALIYYQSENRKTGWIRIRQQIANSPDYVQLSVFDEPAVDILAEHPDLEITCPASVSTVMPGE